MKKMTVGDQQGKWVSVDKKSGCWLWTGHLCQDGYGKSINRDFIGESLAHRLSWLWHRGEIPEGCEIDHKCFVRNCVNPNHLECVTHLENIRRGHARGSYTGTNRNALKTHCDRGHPLSGDNVRVEVWRGVTMRKCKACRALRRRENYHHQKLVRACTGIEIVET